MENGQLKYYDDVEEAIERHMRNLMGEDYDMSNALPDDDD